MRDTNEYAIVLNGLIGTRERSNCRSSFAAHEAVMASYGDETPTRREIHRSHTPCFDDIETR